LELQELLERGAFDSEGVAITKGKWLKNSRRIAPSEPLVNPNVQ